MGLEPVLEQVDDPAAGQCRIDGEVHAAAGPHDQRSGRIDRHDLRLALELPGRHGPAGEAHPQAGVLQQVTGMQRPTAAREIARRGGRRHALATRADGQGDHVLLQAFLVADAGIAARRHDVDEAFVDHHFQSDVRIGGEERRHQGRQHQARRADGDVQPQRACRTVTEAIDLVERRFHLAQRGPQPMKQSRARFGGHDAARAAVEQPNPQAGFQPAQGLAEAGRADALAARRLPEASGARHRHENRQIGHVIRHRNRHCSDFRTTRAD